MAVWRTPSRSPRHPVIWCGRCWILPQIHTQKNTAGPLQYSVFTNTTFYVPVNDAHEVYFNHCWSFNFFLGRMRFMLMCIPCILAAVSILDKLFIAYIEGIENVDPFICSYFVLCWIVTLLFFASFFSSSAFALIYLCLKIPWYCFALT